MFGIEERLLVSAREMKDRAALLESRGLSAPGNEDVILGFFDGERLVATGSLVGNILQGIAVDREMEGEGMAATVTSALLRKAMDRGLEQLFLYSKPDEAKRFEALGFSSLATVTVERSGLGASLLEWGGRGIGKWRDETAKKTADCPEGAGAVVVNCNPFTMGHRSLIEYASARTPWLHVLVVEEDRSLFPFEIRFRLVQEGASDLPNVTVLPGGPYVISSATFPTYFTRIKAEEGERITELYAALDLELFGRYVAPALRVRDRFVGTEPYCPVTSIYNRMMRERLMRGGDGWIPVKVHEMPRFELDGHPVSASRVRALIREGSLDDVRPLVPESTWKWLVSGDAVPVIEKIRSSESRH
jgi:[citrate (pro-3S)-lyase] ligase